MPYRDPRFAADARRAALEEEPSLDDDFSFEMAPTEQDVLSSTSLPANSSAGTAADPGRRAWLAVALFTVACCVAGIVAFLHEPAPQPAAAPRARIDTYFAVFVVSRAGSINAYPGDRCVVDLRLAREGCKMAITCPGVERRFVTPTCAMPAEGAAIAAHAPGFDFDGETVTFVDVDDHGNERGSAVTHIDVWRR
jgi:hypothetical protein